jgi:hypothetical protein
VQALFSAGFSKLSDDGSLVLRLSIGFSDISNLNSYTYLVRCGFSEIPNLNSGTDPDSTPLTVETKMQSGTEQG